MLHRPPLPCRGRRRPRQCAQRVHGCRRRGQPHARRSRPRGAPSSAGARHRGRCGQHRHTCGSRRHEYQREPCRLRRRHGEQVNTVPEENVGLLAVEALVRERRRGLEWRKASPRLAQARCDGDLSGAERRAIREPVQHRRRVDIRDRRESLTEASRDERELDSADPVLADLERAELDEALPELAGRGGRFRRLSPLRRCRQRTLRPTLFLSQLQIHAVTPAGGRGCGRR